MGRYPLFADLSGLPVLVVGGGSVAERKAAALLDAGARVRVGAPQLHHALAQWAVEGRIEHLEGEFQPAWLEGVWLVIAATDDRAINAEVAACADARRIFANVVDDPGLSSFQVPAVIDRAPLTIAISTAGAAPVLARRLREKLEAELDHALGPLIALAQRHRPAIARRLPDLAARRRFYDWLHDGPVMALMRNAQPEQAEQTLLEALREPAQTRVSTGSVVLVGAGPGAPGLLTLQALRALNEADVILHDQLVSPEILALARRDADRVDVGKRGGGKHTPQEHVHHLLLQHAQAGRRVVRLKGGDPFVFGRGGEEMEFLRQHGIAFEVVPGITAAIACAAYAGIALTHREHAQSVAHRAWQGLTGNHGLARAGAGSPDPGHLHGRGPARHADRQPAGARLRRRHAVRADRERHAAAAAGATRHPAAAPRAGPAARDPRAGPADPRHGRRDGR